MTKNNNVLIFDGRKPEKAKTRETSALRNSKKPKSKTFCATLNGNCYEPFGFRDGDIVIFQKNGTDIRHGDLAIVKYNGQEVAFMVYFDDDKVILHGEKIEIFERSKVEFVGRVLRMERDL